MRSRGFRLGKTWKKPHFAFPAVLLPNSPICAPFACAPPPMFRLLSLFLLLPLFVSAQTADFVPDERAYYGLIDRGSGRCLDVASASTASGAPAVQWEFTHANSQQWRFVPLRQRVLSHRGPAQWSVSHPKPRQRKRGAGTAAVSGQRRAAVAVGTGWPGGQFSARK